MWSCRFRCSSAEFILGEGTFSHQEAIFIFVSSFKISNIKISALLIPIQEFLLYPILHFSIQYLPPDASHSQGQISKKKINLKTEFTWPGASHGTCSTAPPCTSLPSTWKLVFVQYFTTFVMMTEIA